MLLGDHQIRKARFSGLDAVFKEFETKHFKALIDRKRSDRVNRALLELIQKEPEPCFLLAAVLDFVERVERKKILHHYTFTSFELWLNQFSGLDFSENFRIRGKIAGKWVPRSEYQALFPIGMGKVYEGTHFVTAHKSPDLDTTVASFWGWVDAFAARVGDSLHIWSLPGGPPPSQIEIDWIFRDLFGKAVFTHLAKTRNALNLTGNDLMSQRGMVRKELSDSIGSIDHERDHNAVVIVDDEGFYLGDWRNYDVESVRQVIILLSSCLRWFENTLHLQLISLLAKPRLQYRQIRPWLTRLFSMKLSECEPAAGFSSKQKKEVSDFAIKVLDVKEGLGASFEEIGVRLARLCKIPFDGPAPLIQSMRKLFDKTGKLLESRPRIFGFLEGTVRELHDAILKIRIRMETMDIALKTKREVFGHSPTFVTVRSDVEEIRQKMGSYLYLTVAYPDQGKMYPVGVISAQDLRKNVLGTVSLRDFCNRDEMSIPPYLDVISVIDHHKTHLQTLSPPFAVIADAQSSNVLVAVKAFEINDRYSLGGQSPQAIESHMRKVNQRPSDASARMLQRLIKRRMAAKQKGGFFIHPEREFVEYLHFLYGILDDTDLLSKVSALDVECVASLLNRLKTLAEKREVEIVSLDDLPKDRSFPRKAAQRILQNGDMYSLYKKVYAHKEKEVEKNISLAARRKASNLFADTKEQGGCCRVGQTKMFASNVKRFAKHADPIRRAWVAAAEKVHKEKPEIDLHLHMTSTIVSAEEVYRGRSGSYSHKDEMWIWIPDQEPAAVEHLKRFLSAFQNSSGVKNNSLEAEFLGANAEELKVIFKESFCEIPHRTKKKNLPIAVLRYKAGTLNSRKAMVSPFLPSIS
jgi:hypothetical protein